MVNFIVYTETEKKILDAARSVFVKKGMYGARMQEIADEAGINKALLHYYFRSKDKLFDAIFTDTISHFIPSLLEILNSENSLEDKIRAFVSHYVDMLWKNPFLPVFIINEIHQNPDRLKMMGGAFEHIKKTRFFKQITRAAETRETSPTLFLHNIINMLSLCVFPILAAPMIKHLFSFGTEDMDKFYEERKKVVPEMIIEYINKSIP
ncbi:MAG: TetR/AcrR family transcriptional regulator [Cyclobacteriaceae bacterium]|nr:TetR/AcrR family transcriptional regulator [Cyclobacteriaceae bacterium]